jgi:hypothetical protein
LYNNQKEKWNKVHVVVNPKSLLQIIQISKDVKHLMMEQSFNVILLFLQFLKVKLIGFISRAKLKENG